MQKVTREATSDIIIVIIIARAHVVWTHQEVFAYIACRSMLVIDGKQRNNNATRCKKSDC